MFPNACIQNFQTNQIFNVLFPTSIQLLFRQPGENPAYYRMCWGRYSRGRDCQLTCELDPGNQRLPTHSPGLGMYAFPTVPTVGAVFKDITLKEQCVVETLWMVYMPEPHEGLLHKLLRFWQAGVESYPSCGLPSQASDVSSLAY